MSEIFLSLKAPYGYILLLFRELYAQTFSLLMLVIISTNFQRIEKVMLHPRHVMLICLIRLTGTNIYYIYEV